jgi:hypothetical protein
LIIRIVSLYVSELEPDSWLISRPAADECDFDWAPALHVNVTSSSSEMYGRILCLKL